MPEINPEKPKALNMALGVGASSVAGAATGVYVVNNVLRAPTVEFMPEEAGAIEATVSLKAEEGINVINGVTKLELPNAPIDTPFGDIGINLHLTKLDQAIQDPETINNLTSLIKKHEVAIEEPIRDVLYASLAKGGGIGAIVGGISGYFLIKKYRKLKDDSNIPKIKEVIPKTSRNKQALMAVCAALAITSTAAASYQINSDSEGVPAKAPTTPLPPEITQNNEILEGARIVGFGADLIDMGVKLVKAYDDDIKDTFAITKDNYKVAFSQYSSRGNYLKRFGNNNKYKTAMHISDTHCNYAMYENALKPVYKKFKPTIILNTGDTFIVGQTMPIENDCMKDLRKAVTSSTQDTLIINSIGNHDGKKPINIEDNPKVITPDDYSGYTTKTPIGDIVTTPDRTITTLETTPPERSNKIYKMMADQSDLTAEKACDVKDKTGEEPIVMVHRPQASYKTSLLGCASLMLKGHTHSRQRIKNIPNEAGGGTLHHTAGSSSGLHNTLSFYETPKKPATYTMFYFDSLNRLKGSTTVTFDTNSRVTIKDEKIPTKLEDLKSMRIQQRFLEKHSSEK